VQNFNEISELEVKLRDLWDIKTKSILEKNSNFDGERITPFFLKMAKGSHSVASMNEICDYNGEPFENTADQKNFIRTYFANSFKKPITEPESLDFLGNDICAHPLVQNLKLSEEEKNSLELPFTEEDLGIPLEGAEGRGRRCWSRIRRQQKGKRLSLSWG
jgi:hypothetical protein